MRLVSTTASPPPSRRLLRAGALALVGTLVAGLTVFEYLHERGDDADSAGALVCTDPASQKASMSDWVLMHLRSHR